MAVIMLQSLQVDHIVFSIQIAGEQISHCGHYILTAGPIRMKISQEDPSTKVNQMTVLSKAWADRAELVKRERKAEMSSMPKNSKISKVLCQQQHALVALISLVAAS